jgi:tRNA (guanine-N7-)-methyltransferase
MMRVPWSAVFGNARPVEVEIGPGRGDAILAFAAAAPDTNFFGIEHKGGAASGIAAAAARRGLGNVRVVGGDARCVVASLIPDASVAAYHVYFPDPWPKTTHRHRRLMTPALAAAIARTLVPGGVIHVASDLEPVTKDMEARLVAAGLTRTPGALPVPRPPTRFETRYAKAGTHYARLTRPATGVR